MEVVFGPNSVDEPNLQYKLQRKIKVFNTTNPLPNRGYNLVACASKYGIVFVGSPDGNLTVYYLQQLIDKECEPQHMTVKLQEKPTHIATSCDQELLAVTGGQLLNIYKITDFQNQNVSPVVSIKTDVNPATFVSALQWNPCIPDTIAIAFYDGTLLVLQVSTSQIKKVPSKARCLCWSPKGKQLVTGNIDGTLSQFKPDLTPAKTIPAPNLFENSPVEALAVYWISTFQFAVVYKNATDNSRPAVTILNTPKAGQSSCQNYEDICYSMGSNRPWYYYLQGLAQWNIIMSSSSNSMEIATLGSADGANWVQWCQTDEARPELPLTDKKQENYPVGVSIDTCAVHQLQWDENTTLPHMPLLHVVSQSGLLTIFNIINLNKEAPQVCAPPQQLVLPAAALTNVIPGEAPPQAAPAQIPVPSFAPTPVVQPKPQPMPLTTPQPPPPSAASSSQFGGVLNIPKPPSYTQSQTQGFAPAPVKLEQKAPLEVKPIPVIQPTPQPTIPQPQPVVNKPTPAQVQENAALKAEQERMNEMKANQELKSMLVKEVNDFQKELYAFMVKTRESQARMQRDIDSINANFNYNSQDAEQLRKECSPDELRSAIVQLKLELVRACAVIAEARTHAEAKDCHQWMQADPLTMKRVASVKKLAYYVQNQLERAQKALDYKWNEAVSRDANHNKPGQRMIRPILDDVYQPLVKQQEILSRQQAVLRTLRNTLNECDISPMFKTTSLLRSTPFRNKDPLSKLTKNILNMSIDTTDSKKKEPLLSSQKLDALRDMLSNHKTVKIKPVNVEMRQHLATMRTNYEKSLKEKVQPVEAVVKTEPDVVPQVKQVQQQPFVPQVEPKVEVKREPVKQSPITVPSFTPLGGVKPGLNNVARTLFTDEPKLEPPKPQVQVPQPKPAPAFSFSSTPASVETRSVLKDLLQNKQAKNDANTFMGQNICSPSSFAFTTTAASSPPAPAPVFTAKPIADINNMFSKFQPQTFVQDPKPQAFVPEPKPQSFTLEAKTQPFALEPKAQPFALEPKAQPFAPESKTLAFTSESKPQGFVPEAKLPPFGLEPKPLALSTESKSATSTAISPKSSETGEPEAETKTVTIKPKADKPITNLFAMKTSTPLPSPHATDVLKPPKDSKTDNTSKLEDKTKSKENVPQVDQKVVQKPSSDTVTLRKPLTAKTSTTPQPVSSSTSSTASSESDSQKSKEINDEAKAEPLNAVEKSDSSTSNTSSSSASSIFAAANATTSTDKAQVTAPSTEQPTSEPDTSTTEAPPTSKPSLFLNITAATSQSAASVFGAAVASQTKPTSPTSIFASGASPSPTPSSVFGTSSQGSIFGNTSPTATTTSVFGSSAQSVFSSAANATKPSVFSTPTPSSPEPSTSPQSVFGSTVTTTTQSGSIFSSSFAQPASSSPSSVFASGTTSVFGPTATTKASVFGATTTTTQSVFGTPTATTQASIFGSTATTTSTSTPSSGAQNIFAAANSTKLSVFGGAGTSVFGSASPNNQTSVFGSPSTQTSVFGTGTASTQASVFGTGTATSQSPVFGSGTATSPASVFGSGTATTQSSLFGTPTPTTQASVFGTPTTQASVFGSQPTTTAQSSSIFGGAEASLFSAASISTTSAPSPTSGGSIFGGISSGSVFGNANTNVFGGKSAFGQSNATAAAIFGGGGATTFGQQKPATNIWSSGNTNPDGGFGSTAFGQQPTTQASSIFGNTTGGSFSTPSPAGQAFGNPQTNQPFGGGDNKPSVFGSPQPAAPAFGGSAAFGSKPVFGQPSGFGSPPSGGGFGSTFSGFNKSPGGGFGAPAAFGGGATFGGGAAFGGTSPGKMFGGNAQPTGFGSPTQSNATFESLATQNTLTFGNLAQQAQAPQPQTPSFNTSPSFTGWRG